MKRITIFLLAFLMILTCAAKAAEDTGSVLEKYEFDENFTYSDEIIAYALKTTVPKVFYTVNGVIEYRPLELDISTLAKVLVYISIEYPDIPTEEVLEVLKENLSEYMSYGSAKQISATYQSSGSGVAISDDGYIATNEHVISSTEEERLEIYLMYNSSTADAVIRDYNNIISQIKAILGDSFTSEDENELFELVVSMYVDDAKIIKEDEPKVTVVYPDINGKAVLESGISYTADILTEGESGSPVKDCAILKIQTDNLVSLRLSDSYPNQSSTVCAAGFPAASEVSSDNKSDELTVTITSGSVSRIVPIDDSMYKSIQTTATINHGNSGGPSVDNKLNIEGLNTLKTEDGYYFMVPAEYINDQCSGFSIGQKDASRIFMLGLQALQGDYGQTAAECFEEVRRFRPDTPYINSMIDTAKAAPQNSMPKIADEDEDSAEIAVIVALIIIIIITAAVIIRRRKHRKKANSFINHDIEINHNIGGIDDGNIFPRGKREMIEDSDNNLDVSIRP